MRDVDAPGVASLQTEEETPYVEPISPQNMQGQHDVGLACTKLMPHARCPYSPGTLCHCSHDLRESLLTLSLQPS